MGESVAVLASTSAVFAGFGITILGVLLTVERNSRTERALLTCLILATSFLFCCALGWSLEAGQLLLIPEQAATFRARFQPAHRGLSILFILAIYLMIASIGLLGYLRSKSVGRLSATCAVIVGIYLTWVLSHFMS